jgi:hypothetical protein
MYTFDRIRAARLWLEQYAQKTRNGDRPTNKAGRALSVLVLTKPTSDYLAEFDPQALKQAQIALDGTSWEDFAEKG